jgi:predicted ATPase
LPIKCGPLRSNRRVALVARHYTEAGQIDKAAELWGKAGQRSLERSALIEAVEQLTRALAQIATLAAMHLALGEQWMRRLDHGLAVLRSDEPATRETAHLYIGAGKDRGHTRRRLRGSSIDGTELRVSVGTAQQKGVELARSGDVVGVGAQRSQPAER